ncbi:FtsH protease regulator HflC [Gloeobacter kilaueensis JS1]|uniref:FtsH protease regulator HflC n=1 Tax=Gloeobacter kilaueensis (strain ATCC BAA-2537 / CCAP 1431/1 / ULC 316 / JS1) TaxID=1183438 RepID=U5QH99_GLOK1|nr:SPFH domain-containing protein [Gloeobacter kilaueensis]AGY58322.1 FtsH protease regulator HflC [Gloeobacter kilaueensis JS1]
MIEFFLLVFGAGLLATIIAGVKIINQGDEALVERLGRFHTKLTPGLHIIIPFIDNIVFKETIREQVLDIQPQQCITKDNVALEADAVIYWRIIDTRRAYYSVANIRQAMTNLVLTALRAEIGKLELDETFASRSEINQALLRDLDASTDPWGIKVTRVEVRNIAPSRTVLDSMEQQMAAERRKRAVILNSEGERQSAINSSQGEAQARITRAEAERQEQVLQAQGTAEALRTLAETLQDPRAREALQFYLARNYLDVANAVGASPSSKVLFMDPQSIPASISALLAMNNAGDAANGSTVLPPLNRVRNEG